MSRGGDFFFFSSFSGLAPGSHHISEMLKRRCQIFLKRFLGENLKNLKNLKNLSQLSLSLSLSLSALIWCR